MRPECRRAAAAYRLALPRGPLSGRLGERQGAGTGSSLEFMDHRDYVPGDDLRHVDWSAYARTDEWKIRLFREEIAPTLDIVTDVSASMAVTEAKRLALVDLVEAAAYWTVRAGGVPRRLAGGAQRFESWEEVRLDGPDEWLPRMPLRRRSLRMLVSDMLSPEDPAPRIRRLAAGAAHCYVLQLLDPWEAEPGTDGPLTLLDCEGSARIDLVLDEAIVARYRSRLRRLCGAVESAVRAVGGTYALVRAAAPETMFRHQLLAQGVLEPA